MTLQAFLTMLIGEPMSFITEPHKKKFGGRIFWEDDRVLLIRNEDLLFALGETNDVVRYVLLFYHVACGVELAFSTVDDNEIREA